MAKDSLIVVSKTREVIKELGKGEIRVSEEFLEALNEKVHAIIPEAIKRVKDNGRATLKASDV